MTDQSARLPLAKSLLATVAFFDTADFPLTLFELYKWLWRPDRLYPLSEVDAALRGLVATGQLMILDGLYYLPGREAIITTRLTRYQIAEEKFAIGLRLARFLRLVPFISLIAVCNTVGYSNAGRASDIDFFIVGRHGRLWTVRLVVTLLTSIVRQRRHGRRITDRVCLSFYAADDTMNLANIALAPIDPYLIYWHVLLAPIYARADINQQFASASAWVNHDVPNVLPVRINQRRTVTDSHFVSLIRMISEKLLVGAIGRQGERLARWLQLAKIRYRPAPAEHGQRSVIINDKLLKFHEVDRRADFRARWETKCRDLGLV